MNPLWSFAIAILLLFPAGDLAYAQEPAWPQSTATMDQIEWVAIRSTIFPNLMPRDAHNYNNEVQINILGATKIGAIVGCQIRPAAWGIALEAVEFKSSFEYATYFYFDNQGMLSQQGLAQLQKTQQDILVAIAAGMHIASSVCPAVARSGWVSTMDGAINWK